MLHSEQSPSVQDSPDPADGLDEADVSRSFGQFDEASSLDLRATPLGVHRSSLGECAPVERSVKVIPYMGTASNHIGNDGDFYLDQLVNVLYGPKKDGVWPDDGIEVNGPILSKRTFWGIRSGHFRSTPKPKRRFLLRFQPLWAFLFQIGLRKR
jgi:hypothetical protein